MVLLNCRNIKSRRLSLHDAQCTLGALTQAGAKTVAELVTDQASLSVNNLERALDALGDALTATIALLFINLNDVPSTHERAQAQL
jgi:hypothetical protein